MEPKKAVFPPLIPFVICSIAGYLMGVMAAGSFSLAAGAAWLVGMAAAIVVVRLLLGTSLRVALGYGSMLAVGWNAGLFLFHALRIVRMGK